MKLFVDSSSWIGLFSERDMYHEVAAQAFQAIASLPVHLYTSDYIIDETLTHLTVTYGHNITIQFGQWVLTSPLVHILRVNEQVWQEAWEMFQKYSDKFWSFTDCTSFILMKQQRLYHAFTFDRHFAQAGFIPWPEREVGG